MVRQREGVDSELAWVELPLCHRQAVRPWARCVASELVPHLTNECGNTCLEALWERFSEEMYTQPYTTVVRNLRHRTGMQQMLASPLLLPSC